MTNTLRSLMRRQSILCPMHKNVSMPGEAAQATIFGHLYVRNDLRNLVSAFLSEPARLIKMHLSTHFTATISDRVQACTLVPPHIILAYLDERSFDVGSDPTNPHVLIDGFPWHVTSGKYSRSLQRRCENLLRRQPWGC